MGVSKYSYKYPSWGISTYKCSYLKKITLVTKSNEPLSSPTGPCAPQVYTLALQSSLYRYFGAKVYIWVHGRVGCYELPVTPNPAK